MLPEDGEELLQRLSTEMGLPDFMDDVSMDIEHCMPPLNGVSSVGEDDHSSSSSETESFGSTAGAGNYMYSSGPSADVDAVAADLLSSGVLDQIMVEEFCSDQNLMNMDGGGQQATDANAYNQLMLNAVQHDGT